MRETSPVFEDLNVNSVFFEEKGKRVLFGCFNIVYCYIKITRAILQFSRFLFP